MNLNITQQIYHQIWHCFSHGADALFDLADTLTCESMASLDLHIVKHKHTHHFGNCQAGLVSKILPLALDGNIQSKHIYREGQNTQHYQQINALIRKMIGPGNPDG